MKYIIMFAEFFKTGLLAIGGGLATLPFLKEMADRYPWFTRRELVDMIAVGESTPGPIGVNMATYAGFSAFGVPGSVLATFALVLPSFLVVLMIAKALNAYSRNIYVRNILASLRPAVAALICSAGLSVAAVAIFDIELYEKTKNLSDLFLVKGVVLFAVLLFATRKFKLHPIAVIAASAVIGMIFSF